MLKNTAEKVMFLVYFMVEKGKSGLAIGKNGAIIKNVSKVLGKAAKVFEFSPELDEMVKSMIPTAKNVEIANGAVTVTIPNSDRSVVIGRSGRNIKVMKEFLNRHFKVNYLRLR